ncbi:MAG TPA: hypothetical protein VK050_03760 [Flavobacteriaceae bacterium]|nr:hypothetical protein [Flavobacteriaceae bacterium]
MTPKNPIIDLVIRYVLSLIALAGVLGLSQELLYTYLLPDIILFNPIWKYYVLLVILSLITFGLVLFVHYIAQNYTGFAFIASIVFKMFVTLWFLFPLIKGDFSNKTPDVLNFFLPFFTFLVLEVLFSIRLLQSKPSV